MLTSGLTENVTVTVKGYFYFVDLGPGVKPRFHSVYSDGRCQCGNGENCPAVTAVKGYRRAGGAQVPRPPLGYYATLPDKCPICASAVYETGRISVVRGIEWGCRKDAGHYRQHHCAINAQYSRERSIFWAFKPVVIRANEMLKVEAILPGDTVLYEGVLREQIGVTQAGQTFSTWLLQPPETGSPGKPAPHWFDHRFSQETTLNNRRNKPDAADGLLRALQAIIENVDAGLVQMHWTGIETDNAANLDAARTAVALALEEKRMAKRMRHRWPVVHSQYRAGNLLKNEADPV